MMCKNDKRDMIENVINHGICVGCGVCDYFTEKKICNSLNEYGQFEAKIIESNYDQAVNEVCPFATSLSEDVIADNLYKYKSKMKHEKYVGYYLENLAGHVLKDKFRSNGSSGGITTWLLTKLMEKKMIDSVIHVKKGEGILFEYAVSNNIEDVINGSKTKYYPVELSKVLKQVKESEKKYAIVGVPCFIKSIRLLQEKDKDIKRNIRYTIGLICGHFKNDNYTKAIAWSIGIPPSKIVDINYRVKNLNETADKYSVQVSYEINEGVSAINKSTKDLYVTNWGYNLFKYKSCDYCDDTFNETADITLGDAWINEYRNDSQGNNILIVRNHDILSLVNDYKEELQLDDISISDIIKSQLGGLRHKTEGLAYRLFIDQTKHIWFPKKRIQPSDIISKNRKKIFEQRIKLYQQSNESFRRALEYNDFSYFDKKIKKEIHIYSRLYTKNHIKIIVTKIINMIRKSKIKQ